MSRLEKLEWDARYSVDIEEIDAHQKKMFDLLNQLIDLRESGLDPKESINIISEINEYSKLYFGTEEKYLKKKGYPDFAAHSKIHRQFIKHAISLRREVSEDSWNLTDEMIITLKDWLMNHILTVDSLYVPFLRINAYIEESKQK